MPASDPAPVPHDDVWITDAHRRKRLVQLSALAVLLNSPVRPGSVAFLRKMAEHLVTHDAVIDVIEALAAGKHLKVRMLASRRAFRVLAKEPYTAEGVMGVLRFFGAMLLKARVNRNKLWDYKRVGLLPEGTLGREYWKHLTEIGFGFPGEPGGIADVIAYHDVAHVLAEHRGFSRPAASYSSAISANPGAHRSDRLWRKPEIARFAAGRPWHHSSIICGNPGTGLVTRTFQPWFCAKFVLIRAPDEKLEEPMAKLNDPVQLAVIGAAHGTRGELRVKTFTGDPMALGDYGMLYDVTGRPFEVLDIRPAKTVVVVRFRGVNDRNMAEALNGTTLFIDRSQLPQDLDEDEISPFRPHRP